MSPDSGGPFQHDFPTSDPLTLFSHALLDRPFSSSLLICFVGTVLVILLHCFCALTAPTFFNSKTRTQNVFSEMKHGSWSADLTLHGFVPQHHFLLLTGSFLVNTSVPDPLQPLEFSHRVITSNRDIEVTRQDDQHLSTNITFPADFQQSYPFQIVRLSLGDCDRVNIHVRLHTSLENIVSFQFRWYFFNPAGDLYCRRYLMSLSVICGYLTFFVWLKRRPHFENWSQLFVLLLGVSGFFAGNPLGWISADDRFLRLGDFLCVCFFVSVFRLFVLLELESLRAGATPPGWVFVLAAYFAGHATLDVAAGFNRARHLSLAESEPFVVLPAERVLVLADSVYIGVVFVWLLAVVFARCLEKWRALVLAFLVVVSAAVTGWSHVFCVVTGTLMYTVAPRMIFAAAHLTLAGLALLALPWADQAGVAVAGQDVFLGPEWESEREADGIDEGEEEEEG
jgi:hypothetical protein